MLKVGDKVIWRNAWGTLEPVTAIVEGIEVNCKGKEGTPVNEVPWEQVKRGGVVVDLSNGCWAYGYQISKFGVCPVCESLLDDGECLQAGYHDKWTS